MASYVSIEDVILTKHSNGMSNYPDTLRVRDIEDVSSEKKWISRLREIGEHSKGSKSALGMIGGGSSLQPLGRVAPVGPKLEASQLEFSGLSRPCAIQDQYERHLGGLRGNIVDEVDVERLTSELAEGIRREPFGKSPVVSAHTEKLDKLNYVLHSRLEEDVSLIQQKYDKFGPHLLMREKLNLDFAKFKRQNNQNPGPVTNKDAHRR